MQDSTSAYTTILLGASAKNKYYFPVFMDFFFLPGSRLGTSKQFP